MPENYSRLRSKFLAEAECKKADSLVGIGYLFGYPIEHSLSPLLHQTVYDELGLRRSQFPIASTDLKELMKFTRDPDFFGASVTMPHKVEVMRYLHILDTAAKEVGAVNTIAVGYDSETSVPCLIGINTDIVGIREAFYQNVSSPEAVFEGKPAVIVGAGGAGRSAAYALRKWMKVGRIYIVNRFEDEARAVIERSGRAGYGEGMEFVGSVAKAEGLEDPGAIVSCVPDVEPDSEEEWEVRRVLEHFLGRPHKGAVLEMCYHPRPWTRIAEVSKRAGWQVILGTEAMIYQGLEQDRCWTDSQMKDLPVEKVKEVIHREVEKTGL